MSNSSPPRAVVVSRPSEYELLLERHATLAQARFFLESRDQPLEPVLERHAQQQVALSTVLAAIPSRWRRALVKRSDLSRFLFGPEDVVLAVGQDGLVANVAKYLEGQPVIGVNPSRALYDGVLVRHAPAEVGALLEPAAQGQAEVETRALVEAETPGGQRLRALNELYVGHCRHQSARYSLCVGDQRERQSSSGLIVSTGTGASGWARSIREQRSHPIEPPEPTSSALVYYVREAFPSVVSGNTLTEGLIADGERLLVLSEMNEGGVCFGDGLEEDHLPLPFGQPLTVRRSSASLRLVIG